MQLENNKRIAKNAIMLFIRMLLTLVVNLFASRVILDTLGVVDFGIYSVVGGVVAMFTFLNATLSSSTARFLTYEIGTSNKDKLAKVFGASITIHLILAFFIFILLETIGLWFLNYELVIPENRIFAANIVFQFSILSSIISIIKVPYNAAIIAHERMNVYAFVSIIEASLKLIIVFLLVIGELDKLISYASLMFIVTAIISIIYMSYGYRNFDECKFKISLDKEIIKPILSFSSWDLYGNMSVMARGQGINIMLNLFFGPIINAASGIATQVQNAIGGFTDSFLVAVRPQIVKNYAKGDINEMQKLIFASSKFSFLLLFIISFPLVIENRFVLNLWLKNVPEFAVIFCQLSVINSLISIMFRTIMFSIHATGKVKRMSVINGTIYLFVIPISYIMLKVGLSPVVPFIVNILLLVLGCFSNLITLQKYIPEFSISKFYHEVILVCLLIVLISSIIPLGFYHIMETGFVRFVLVSLTSAISISVSSYYIAMNKEIRNQLKLFVLSKINIK
jgi:Na+-driven multidrug efflux pump